MNTTGLIVTVAVLVAASGFALWWNGRSGRVRTVDDSSSARPIERLAELAQGPVTLVQFSAEVCSQCAATRRLLTKMTDAQPGVTHVELDVADELEAVRELDVRRTPTTFVVDGSGSIVYRVSGVPRQVELAAAIDGLLSDGRAVPATAAEIE